MNRDVRKFTVLMGVLVFAAAAPALIHDGTIRLVTAGVLLLGIMATVRLLVGKILVIRDSGETGQNHREEVQAVDPAPVAELLDRSAQMVPVLVNQLESVIEETETAVLDIGEGFMGIISRARSQASRAANALGDFAGNNGEDSKALIQLSRESLGAVIGNLQSVNGLARETLSGIQKITGTMESIREVVSEIEYIADQTNLLALNASIEAARAGNYGRGFAVVADEVRKLSLRSTSAASDIGKLIRNIETDITGIYQETEKSAERTEQRSIESERIMNDTLGRLDDVMASVQGELDSLATETECLAGDISGIVMSMQFQDITRQKIEHVIEPLREMQSESEVMARNLRNPSLEFEAGGSKDRISWLENMYTMESERQVMRETMSGNGERAGQAAF
jgi:methyl-accepting chemotaxis protein